MLVVNYPDRERYLDCLKQSNLGDLSALMEFMLECFNEQLADFEAVPEPLAEELSMDGSEAGQNGLRTVTAGLQFLRSAGLDTRGRCQPGAQDFITDARLAQRSRSRNRIELETVKMNPHS